MQLGTVKLSTIPVEQPDLSKGARRLPEDTRNRRGKAEPARAPSATTTMAESQEVTHRAEVPASAVEGHMVAVEGMVVAGAINPDFEKRGEAICRELS